MNGFVMTHGLRRSVTILFPAFMVLAGCTLHRPQKIEPPSPLPESFVEQTEPGVPIKRWWETFGDENLNALMEEAFSNNPDLSQAYARLDQLEAVYKTARAARLPTLDARGEWSREDTPSFFGNNTGDSYRLSASAGFELDLWRKLRSRSRAAKLEVEASRNQVMTLYLTLSAQVVDNYYMAVEQRAQLELTDRTIESFADTLSRVERRYREGLVPALDVYQARQNLAGARSRRSLFESGRAQAENNLAILLGRYPQNSIAGDVVVLPETPAAFPAGLPSELLTRRPDVEAAFLRVKASDERIAAAIADRFPSFNLLGNYGTQSITFSTGALEGKFWKIFVNSALPFVDGGRRRAEVKRTEAVFRENLALYHKTVLTAFQEVENALVRNRTTEDRIARLEEKVAATEAAHRLSLRRYLQGLSDYLPVLTAQALYFDAQSDLLAARRQLISDRVSLARSLGGNWMVQEMRERLTAKAQTQSKE